MQTKIFRIRKIFSPGTEKHGKPRPKFAILPKTPAATFFRRWLPRKPPLLPAPESSQTGYLPGKRQTSDTPSTTVLPAGKFHRPGFGASCPRAAGSRRKAPEPSPLPDCMPDGGPPPPGSSKEPPPALFPWFFVDQGRYVAIHHHLAALQREGLQL